MLVRGRLVKMEMRDQYKQWASRPSPGNHEATGCEVFGAFRASYAVP